MARKVYQTSLTKREIEKVRELAKEWEVSISEAIRQMINDYPTPAS
ncbi:MAG: ribbon-helix-helix protein, CopG family [Aeromonas sp.]